MVKGKSKSKKQTEFNQKKIEYEKIYEKRERHLQRIIKMLCKSLDLSEMKYDYNEGDTDLYCRDSNNYFEAEMMDSGTLKFQSTDIYLESVKERCEYPFNADLTPSQEKKVDAQMKAEFKEFVSDVLSKPEIEKVLVNLKRSKYVKSIIFENIENGYNYTPFYSYYSAKKTKEIDKMNAKSGELFVWLEKNCPPSQFSIDLNKMINSSFRGK